MLPFRYQLVALLSAIAPLAAQQTPTSIPVAVDSAVDSADAGVDDEGVRLGLQFGLATGALHYKEGRSEQALGALIRWAPTRWFSLSGTPTGVRVEEPTSSTTRGPRSGLTDVPLEATATHAFSVAYKPTVSGSFGVMLPLGDTAGGFGTGRLGSSLSIGLGLAPSERIWTHLGAGRSLSGFTTQSAFTGSDGWGDASAGYAVTERCSVSAGFGTDLGSYDATIGRSMSVSGGLDLVVVGATTLHLNASHGLGGAAPTWSVGMAFGTAFPYLNHLGAGSSMGQGTSAFGGGTHGLSTGVLPGSGHGRR
ncbi:MAG: hypothetical protein ACJ8AD_20270 [Gemmatimonadaceae bacterium]